MRVVFMHGACVKDGSCWWHRTAGLLAERGVASEAPALPSCGEMGESSSAGGPGLVQVSGAKWPLERLDTTCGCGKMAEKHARMESHAH